MHLTRQVFIAKAVIGLLWVLGIAELIHPHTHIPPWVLYAAIVFSLVAHAFQSVFFLRKYGKTVSPAWPHVLQIMAFGAPHLLGFKVRHPEGCGPDVNR